MLFCCIYRRYENSADCAALIVKILCRIAVDYLGFYENFKPVFRFIAFFQGNLKFCDKIRFSVSVIRFVDISAYARRRTFELINKRIMTFYYFAEFNDFTAKSTERSRSLDSDIAVILSFSVKYLAYAQCEIFPERECEIFGLDRM